MIKKTHVIQILGIVCISSSLFAMPTENVMINQLNSTQIITQNAINKTVTTNHTIEVNQAPLFSTKTIKRKKFKLEKALKKGPVIINFWATWCAPCIDEMQTLKKIRKTLKKKHSKVKSMVKKYKFPFKIIHDSNKDIYRLYNATNVPATYIINENGNIIYQHIGFNKETKDTFIDAIEKM